MEYDYVVIGAGSAGCVIASRLTEGGFADVLLLEAGGSDRHPMIQIPMGAGKLRGRTAIDWMYVSEPVPNLGNRRLPVPRGKVLGGSSAINMMVYTRGDRRDYDRWSDAGLEGWSYADLLPYFRKAERWTGPAAPFRGETGPLGTQHGPFHDPLRDAWLAAAETRGYRHVADPNGGDVEGFADAQFTVARGRRASAYRAYLHGARGRRNLTLRTASQVRSLVTTGNRVTGVRYARAGGTVETVTARREVILCAGSYNSPQILLLSGIGPADDLAALGIPVVADLPVGRGLQEHLSVFNQYRRRGTGPFHASMRFDRVGVNMLRAGILRSGPATGIPLSLVGYVRTDPAAQAPDIEFTLPMMPPQARPWFPGIAPAFEDGFGIRTILLHPESRGRVTLRSADPGDPPRIAFDFLTHPDDLPRLRRGFRIGRDLAQAAALDAYRGDEVLPGAAVQSDDELDAYIRATAQVSSHPVGTCAMGQVVDARLKVMGIDGLRVCDASAMPDLPSSHINADVIMLAEKAADMIRAADVPPATGRR